MGFVRLGGDAVDETAETAAGHGSIGNAREGSNVQPSKASGNPCPHNMNVFMLTNYRSVRLLQSIPSSESEQDVYSTLPGIILDL